MRKNYFLNLFWNFFTKILVWEKNRNFLEFWGNYFLCIFEGFFSFKRTTDLLLEEASSFLGSYFQNYCREIIQKKTLFNFEFLVLKKWCNAKLFVFFRNKKHHLLSYIFICDFIQPEKQAIVYSCSTISSEFRFLSPSSSPIITLSPSGVFAKNLSQCCSLLKDPQH